VALVALGQPLRDSGREALAASGVALLDLGRVVSERAPVADQFAALRARPPEHAQLALEVGRPLRRVLPCGLGRAAAPLPTARDWCRRSS
jgi:hypothetical protein